MTPPKLSLTLKLPLIMVALTAVFLVTVSFLVYKMAEADIRKSAYFSYETAANASQTAVETRMSEIRKDMVRNADLATVFRTMNNFNREFEKLAGKTDPVAYLTEHYLKKNPKTGVESEQLTDPDDGSYYSQMHISYHAAWVQARKLGGYRNIYLFNAEGRMLYSVLKEADFVQDFSKGTFAQTALGKLYAQAIKSGKREVSVSDIAPYAPSGGEAVGFMAVPIYKKGKDTPFGVMAVQFDAAQLQGLMQQNLEPGGHQNIFLASQNGVARTASTEEGLFVAGDQLPVTAAVEAAKSGETGLFENVVSTAGWDAIAVTVPVAAEGFDWTLVLETDRAVAMASVNNIRNMALLLIGAAVVLSTGVSWVAANRVTKPIIALSGATDALAGGDYVSDIRGKKRGDELGDLARAMTSFRDKLKDADEASAREVEAGRKTAHVVERMSSALSELERGNLTCDIREPFADRYEALRENFNRSLVNLRQSMGQVVDSSLNVGRYADEQKASATDMADRTESQASTLEETATAIQDLTQGVRATADSAAKVDQTMRGTREEAERSSEVVTSAVQAMDEIQNASNEISQIINMIDDIAFQTNLLALNAGVEAARAGTAGAGFAVVASEVRALAQRASEAAGQIKELTTSSEGHVANGVSMVARAGDALTSIIGQVKEVSGLVSEIADGVQTQSSGLENINDAMAQLDMVTQQNTAMAEEASAASQLLQDEAQSLSGIVSRFQLPAGGGEAALDEAFLRSA
jgi:methyl-accepting chemotaxis protein